MENMRELRRRIKSAAATRQMAEAMKMVSVSRLRRVQSRAAGARDYETNCAELMAAAAAAAGGALPPALRPPQGGEPCRVLLTGSRGLCGTYHHELLNWFSALTAEQPGGSVVVCGRWGCERAASLPLPVLRAFPGGGDLPTLAECREITDYLTELYCSGRACRVELVYQDFRSALKREPVCRTFLPAAETGGAAEAPVYDFEPEAGAVLEALTDRYLRTFFYAAALSAAAGEHSARLTAMSSAADNAAELGAELTGRLNRARQSAVTTELLELLGGSALPEDTE